MDYIFRRLAMGERSGIAHKSIRKGQAEGVIRRQGETDRWVDRAQVQEEPKPSPRDFASHSEFYGNSQRGGSAVTTAATVDRVPASGLDRPTDFAGKRELYGSDVARPGILAVADSSEDEFGVELDEAKAEGNVAKQGTAPDFSQGEVKVSGRTTTCRLSGLSSPDW